MYFIQLISSQLVQLDDPGAFSRDADSNRLQSYISDYTTSRKTFWACEGSREF
jgi:hypothetical protein